MFGISRENFEYLKTDEALALVDKHISSDPTSLALKGIKPVICNQIKYLNRCKSKLPLHYEARAIIPPLSYEQSSSQLSSATRKERGKKLLDLTCGLGVDSYNYSKNFQELITIERDSLIADIAKENFKRLGAENIEVINSSCEDFISNYTGEPFDLIYVDPARRDMTKKVFLIEDCSPDIVQLLPALSSISKKLIIKLSPLFDRSEAERIFGSRATIKAVSVAGECKELIVEVNFTGSANLSIITDSVTRNGEIAHCEFNSEELQKVVINPLNDISDYDFISIADVSLRKMRCCDAYYAKYHSSNSFYSEDGVAIWRDKPLNFNGRLYTIESAMPYKPKEFKRMKIKRATIIIQNFPHSASAIKKTLSIIDGDSKTLLFTTLKGEPYIFILQ